jgi:hypothetical protein
MAGIKGSAIESLVAEVNRLLLEGQIRQDELEAKLQPEDLEILGQRVQAALWYPLGTYERLTQLMLQLEGRGEIEYVVERGRKAAARLRDSGIYAQLTSDRNKLGDRLGRIMVTLGPAMYHDTQWSFHFEHPRSLTNFRIETRVPSAFPELARFAAQGFIEYLSNSDRARPIVVSSERASPTLIVFRAKLRE